MQITANPTPPNQYYRKVNMGKTFKHTIKVLGLYFTVSNCTVKKRVSCGYTRNTSEARVVYRAKRKLYDEHNGQCQHCGCKVEMRKIELHHILPCSRFQELQGDERNMLLLCHRCHKEIHCNPFLDIKLMEAKAKELGINLHERYNYDDKSK